MDGYEDGQVCQNGAIKGPQSVISIGDAGYPQALMGIQSPPERLYVLGDPASLAGGLAVIGPAKATEYGISCTDALCRTAARAGATIVSGGARGCSLRAHLSALGEEAKTIVVSGCGADVAYPACNAEVLQWVVDSGGAIVSESPWGTPPAPWALHARNRIIAGLSQAILVIEAKVPSGTFSLAEAAMQERRDVLAVPGPINSPCSYGPNLLIARGAWPIIDEEVLIEALKANLII